MFLSHPGQSKQFNPDRSRENMSTCAKQSILNLYNSVNYDVIGKIKNIVFWRRICPRHESALYGLCPSMQMKLLWRWMQSTDCISSPSGALEFLLQWRSSLISNLRIVFGLLPAVQLESRYHFIKDDFPLVLWFTSRSIVESEIFCSSTIWCFR